MSTYLHLVCLDHTPPLKAEGESGQHMHDLPQIRADIAERERIVANVQDGVWPGDHFRKNTAAFLAKHPRCRIGIEDEYGETHPTEEDTVTATDPLRLTPAEVEQVEAALTADPKVIPELARLIARVHELEGLLIDTGDKAFVERQRHAREALRLRRRIDELEGILREKDSEIEKLRGRDE